MPEITAQQYLYFNDVYQALTGTRNMPEGMRKTIFAELLEDYPPNTRIANPSEEIIKEFVADTIREEHTACRTAVQSWFLKHFDWSVDLSFLEYIALAEKYYERTPAPETNREEIKTFVREKIPQSGEEYEVFSASYEEQCKKLCKELFADNVTLRSLPFYTYLNLSRQYHAENNAALEKDTFIASMISLEFALFTQAVQEQHGPRAKLDFPAYQNLAEECNKANLAAVPEKTIDVSDIIESHYKPDFGLDGGVKSRLSSSRPADVVEISNEEYREFFEAFQNTFGELRVLTYQECVQQRKALDALRAKNSNDVTISIDQFSKYVLFADAYKNAIENLTENVSLPFPTFKRLWRIFSEKFTHVENPTVNKNVTEFVGEQFTTEFTQYTTSAINEAQLEFSEYLARSLQFDVDNVDSLLSAKQKAHQIAMALGLKMFTDAHKQVFGPEKPLTDSDYESLFRTFVATTRTARDTHEVVPSIKEYLDDLKKQERNLEVAKQETHSSTELNVTQIEPEPLKSSDELIEEMLASLQVNSDHAGPNINNTGNTLANEDVKNETENEEKTSLTEQVVLRNSENWNSVSPSTTTSDSTVQSIWSANNPPDTPNTPLFESSSHRDTLHTAEVNIETTMANLTDLLNSESDLYKRDTLAFDSEPTEQSDRRPVSVTSSELPTPGVGASAMPIELIEPHKNRMSATQIPEQRETIDERVASALNSLIDAMDPPANNNLSIVSEQALAYIPHIIVPERLADYEHALTRYGQDLDTYEQDLFRDLKADVNEIAKQAAISFGNTAYNMETLLEQMSKVTEERNNISLAQSKVAEQWTTIGPPRDSQSINKETLTRLAEAYTAANDHLRQTLRPLVKGDMGNYAEMLDSIKALEEYEHVVNKYKSELDYYRNRLNKKSEIVGEKRAEMRNEEAHLAQVKLNDGIAEPGWLARTREQQAKSLDDIERSLQDEEQSLKNEAEIVDIVLSKIYDRKAQHASATKSIGNVTDNLMRENLGDVLSKQFKKETRDAYVKNVKSKFGIGRSTDKKPTFREALKPKVDDRVQKYMQWPLVDGAIKKDVQEYLKEFAIPRPATQSADEEARNKIVERGGVIVEQALKDIGLAEALKNTAQTISDVEAKRRNKLKSANGGEDKKITTRDSSRTSESLDKNSFRMKFSELSSKDGSGQDSEKPPIAKQKNLFRKKRNKKVDTSANSFPLKAADKHEHFKETRKRIRSTKEILANLDPDDKAKLIDILKEHPALITKRTDLSEIRDGKNGEKFSSAEMLFTSEKTGETFFLLPGSSHVKPKLAIGNPQQVASLGIDSETNKVKSGCLADVYAVAQNTISALEFIKKEDLSNRFKSLQCAVNVAPDGKHVTVSVWTVDTQNNEKLQGPEIKMPIAGAKGLDALKLQLQDRAVFAWHTAHGKVLTQANVLDETKSKKVVREDSKSSTLRKK